MNIFLFALGMGIVQAFFFSGVVIFFRWLGRWYVDMAARDMMELHNLKHKK